MTEPVAAPAPTPALRRRGRGWRVVALVILLPLVLLLALRLWAQQPGSLATALSLLGYALPPGQQLQIAGVRGTLAEGGQIARLDWQQGERALQMTDLDVSWSAPALLHGRLELPRLHARQAIWTDTRPASTNKTAPPTDLRLPLPVQIDWQLGQLQIQGRNNLSLSDLAGQYRYEGGAHQLSATRWQLAQGHYQLDAQLQALPPFALKAQASGDIASPLPAPAPPLRLHAQAQAQGPLAQLQVQAQVSPMPISPAQAASRQPQPQASLSAQIQPWQTQPLAQAQGAWRDLNPALFWPGAPQGQISGQLQVTPGAAAGTWAGELSLNNRASGPWNQGRWPLDQLQLRALWQGTHWQVPQFLAQGAGGQIQGQATLETPAKGQPPHWQAQVKLQHLNPARIDSRWASLPLGGQIQAAQAPGQPLRFEAHIQAEGNAPASGPALTALRQLQARGQWQQGTLTLEQVDVQTTDARLQGQGRWQQATQLGAGQFQLQAPGLNAQVDGELGRLQGAGRAQIHLSDAAATSRWLAHWPGLTLPELQGVAEFDGRWQGGWGDWARMQWQATLDVPRLAPANPANSAAPPWRVADLHADLNGPVSGLQLSLRGAGAWQGQPLHAEVQAQLNQSAPGQWQARISRWQAQASLSTGDWRMVLAQPTQLTWQQSSRSLNLEPGTLNLSSPSQGSAQIAWQASRWTQVASGGTGAAQWSTQGQIRGIPLAWLELVGGPALAPLGLRGDLQFNGDWQASANPGLTLRATLARSSGDLSLQGDDERAPPLTAGIREAKLELQAQGPQVSARLVWDSQRAGQAQISAQTELQSGPEGWTWSPQAPVRGQVRAQLPKVGLWSVLAPPGWRLRGTLDANATLSGTRIQPQWHGSLNADDLAVRSVADGIEFGQGRLRTTLANQRLSIDEFSLKGAGNGGGQLSAHGSVLWPSEGNATGLQRLRMALDVQLQQLRVSGRVDRRLVLSGQINAQLEQAKLVLRGQLRADQALFVLPDDSAPRLGADVVVTQRNASPAPIKATGGGLQVQPDVQLRLDLGSDFALRGRGLDTKLTGQLELQSQGSPLRPRLTGEIRTVGGTYQAYGQHLDIDTGVLRFTGPYDNPSLDVLAIRPNLSQKVGVQVSGNVLLPRVRLWAESNDLTDADKLAWLVLGRAAANGGGESAMLQQAALALLGGNGPGLSGQLAQALGLDELSVRGATTLSDGSTSAATVTLGKRLSRQFYVAYERSLAGTLGTFYIFYDLSRRFTLRAQMGQQSAADLIFTLRYD